VRRLLVLALVAFVFAPQAAAAHGGEGLLELVDQTPSDVGSDVTYRVSLVYVNDGDPVGGATVTATPSLGDQIGSTITLEPAGDGIYEGTVSFPTPGRWTVRFATEDPPARLRTTFRVEPPPPPTTAAPVPTTSGPPPTSTPIEPQLADEDADDSGPPTGLIVGLVLTGLAAVVTATVLVVQRRRRAP
jgi:hypothetical protein